MIHGAQAQAFCENILSSATTTKAQHPPSLPLPPSRVAQCCSVCWLTGTGSSSWPLPQPHQACSLRGCSPPRHSSVAAAAHFLSCASRKECTLHQNFRKMTLNYSLWGFFYYFCHKNRILPLRHILPYQVPSLALIGLFT